MNPFHTSESRASDELLDGSLSESDADDVMLSDEELRLARIEEYSHESLHDDDHLVASLGAVTGGILRLIQRYEKATFKLLDDKSSTAHDPPELHRAMGTLLNLARQAERNVNLVTRLTEDRRHGAHTKSQRRQAIVPGSASESSRRNIR